MSCASAPSFVVLCRREQAVFVFAIATLPSLSRGQSRGIPAPVALCTHCPVIMNLTAEITFDQALKELELRIARRADELAHFQSHPINHLAAWEQAEREIWNACLREIEATLPESTAATPTSPRTRTIRRGSVLASPPTPTSALVNADVD